MIEVRDVTKTFGRKKVLKGVSFTAEKGDITCIVGINGTGKTTIMHTIMALTPMDRGQIHIDGERVTKKSYEKMAFIPDTMTMPPNMRIREAFAFMNDFYDNWNMSRAHELRDFFGLDEAERITDLSKGNAAKVNLIFGLAMDAEYLLMDEPFSGIDMFSREQITAVFTSHLVEDRGVIITTHEIGDIEHLIDRVVMLDNGQVIKTFQADEIRETEGKSVTDVMREVYQP